MKEEVERISHRLKESGMTQPEVGIVLGTGLGSLVDNIDIHTEIPYSEIPGFPISTVEFHQGKLIYGRLENNWVLAMQGRFHYYEGYSMAQVVLPIRVMHTLGVKKLLISNAAGNMNMDWKKGELMLIEDHINLQPDNPLRGAGASDYGQIFVDMSAPYNNEMNRSLITISADEGINLNRGTYVAVAGPNLETRAEYKFLRQIGADVVGMSTVPEVIAANQLGLPVAAVSVLTDDCDPDNLLPINIENIIETARVAEKDLVKIFRKYIASL